MASRRDARLRLDQPAGTPRRRQLRPSYDSEAFGRVAEVVARYLGTPRYLVLQTVVVIVWALVNAFGPDGARFDRYPFIFLTLVLSLQASYAAPLILLAQNRQTDRDRANLVEDREQAVRNLDDTEFLARELAEVRLALGDVVTRDFLRSELRELLEERGVGRGAGGGGDGTTKSKRKSKPKRKRPDGPRDGDGSPLVTEPQQPDEHHDDGSDPAQAVPDAAAGPDQPPPPEALAEPEPGR